MHLLRFNENIPYGSLNINNNNERLGENLYSANFKKRFQQNKRNYMNV